jgi:hypothetical protein
LKHSRTLSEKGPKHASAIVTGGDGGRIVTPLDSAIEEVGMRHVQRLLTVGAVVVLVATAMLATAEVASRPARGETVAPAGADWAADNERAPTGAEAGVIARAG